MENRSVRQICLALLSVLLLVISGCSDSSIEARKKSEFADVLERQDGETSDSIIMEDQNLVLEQESLLKSELEVTNPQSFIDSESEHITQPRDNGSNPSESSSIQNLNQTSDQVAGDSEIRVPEPISPERQATLLALMERADSSIEGDGRFIVESDFVYTEDVLEMIEKLEQQINDDGNSDENYSQ